LKGEPPARRTSNNQQLETSNQQQKMENQNNTSAKCFVCNQSIPEEEKTRNSKTNLPVCKHCQGTPEEKKAEQEAIDSLGEGFICGCI